MIDVRFQDVIYVGIAEVETQSLKGLYIGRPKMP